MQPKQPAENSLQILPSGIVELKQTGFQTKDSIVLFQAKIDDLTADMVKQGKKMLILVDVTGVTGQEPEVLGMARERLKGDFTAMALVGTSPAIKMIINWLLHATGDDKRIKSFGTRDEATAWLLSR